MLFDDDSSHFKVRRVVKKNRNNLINSRFDHRDEIASFLRSHFHDANEVEKRNSLNTDSYFIEFFLNFFYSFN